jgi:hypothetical protein
MERNDNRPAKPAQECKRSSEDGIVAAHQLDTGFSDMFLALSSPEFWLSFDDYRNRQRP